ncbi:ATP synthase F1 subunit epsilon [Acetobacteraceae bacterium]|nr:ATP synthase F1 subunit epsilon [Acetobacteraceae bacterium]
MTIQLELLSPHKSWCHGEYDMVVVPGSEGDLGALEGHEKTSLSLRAGLVTLFQGGEAVKNIFVGAGFAQITPKSVTVLASEVKEVTELSVDVARQKLEAAMSALTNASAVNQADLFKLSQEIQKAQAELHAAKEIIK